MSEGFHFLWFDDDPSMKQAADSLAAITDAQVGFHLSDQGLAQEIDKLIQEHVPDLVIVDHKLNWDLGASDTSLKATGATVAELIKDCNPQVPVVCVTKVNIDKDITYAQKSVYDYVVDAGDVTRQSRPILSIAMGFREIKGKPPKSPEEVLQLLDCPQVDYDRLKQVLPDNVKAEFVPGGYASLLLRWIMDVLFARPGFLYDSLWTATLAGANERVFNQVQEKLKPAKYKGIFANDVYPRWWVSRILKMLYKTELADKENDPRLLGRHYLEIPAQEYSKCEISGDDLPDVVAYTDITNKGRMQVCLQHTKEHPGFQKRLFFEEIRMIKGEGE